MTRFLSRWFVLTIAAGVMVALIPGMRPIGHPAIVGVAAFALFTALINASIKPVMQLFSLPFSILTFGFGSLVVNWLCMCLASWLALALFGTGVVIRGFWVSVLGSFIMMLVSWLVESVIGL